jgi:hypothetical protein
MGDLNGIKANREAFKARVAEVYPGNGAIPGICETVEAPGNDRLCADFKAVVEKCNPNPFVEIIMPSRPRKLTARMTNKNEAC